MDLKEIFTPERIEYFKTHKNEITFELLQNLRRQGNEGKQIALDILDTEMSPDNYYLDAFGKKIFFMGDRNLKRAYTSMNLSPIHIEEIKRCSNDLKYFMDNYIKIRTKKGYNFPELRQYQQRFIDVLNSDYESIVAMLGRQCCDGKTTVHLEDSEISLENLYSLSKPSNVSLNSEFLESREVQGKILTPLGYKEIEYIHKTIPYEKYLIKTENGYILECAEKHVLIDKDYNEVYAKDSLGIEVITETGISKVSECIDLGFKQCMYDISIKEDTELYFSNGILSHNSGKSVTVAIFMCWHFNFNHDLNIGICANKGSLAREFLNNVKEMFYSMPMWLRQGVTAWTKSSIESELKMRILTDVPGENAFRGFSISLLCMDETAWLPANKFFATMDSILPSQSAMSWKKNIFISTPNGMNHFYDMVMGSRKRKVLYDLSEEQIQNLKDKVLSKKDNGNGLFDVTIDKPSNNMALFEMDWQDVPRYNSKGQKITPNEFKDDIVAKNGLTFFNQNYACVKSSTQINIYNTVNRVHKTVKIGELYGKDCSNILIQTQSGFSHFDGIRKLSVPKTLKFFFNNTFIEVSENHRFIKFGKEVFAKTLKVGDSLQTLSETVIITKIETVSEPTDVYDVLETKDHTYITNGVISHNCDFIGSSYTLVSADSLKRFTPKDPLQIIANRLKVFEEPQKGHKYIMGVDPAKFGADSFAIQILDVSTFPFIQVASARLPNENFQIMPEFLYDWGKYYNEAFMIIENNDGAGTYINTVLQTDYEYENLFFEKTFDTYKNHSKTKIEPGFRTNVRNRALILDVLKLLIDNQKLIVNDAETIKEFNTFVLKNNKYQADDGFHDDLIMALGISLALFGDAKNFENISEMTKKLYSNDSDIDFTDYLCLGSFDDFSDSESFSEQNTIDPLETFELNDNFKTW